MRLVRRLRGSSLLVRFAVLSLVLTLGVGVLLAHVLTSTIEDRAREQAEWTVVGTVRLGLQPHLTPTDLAHGFEPERLASVDRTIAEAADNPDRGGVLGDLDPVALKIYGADGLIVWADDPSLIGQRSTSDDLAAALRGEVVSEFAHDHADGADSDAGDRQVLEVYVPLRYEGWPDPSGPWSSTCPTRRWPRPSARTCAR